MKAAKKKYVEDRTLAISDHAVDQLYARLETARGFSPVELRRIVAAEVARGVERPHIHPGQTLMTISLLGESIELVLGADTTGWTKGVGSARGRAVVTVMHADDRAAGGSSNGGRDV